MIKISTGVRKKSVFTIEGLFRDKAFSDSEKPYALDLKNRLCDGNDLEESDIERAKDIFITNGTPRWISILEQDVSQFKGLGIFKSLDGSSPQGN